MKVKRHDMTINCVGITFDNGERQTLPIVHLVLDSSYVTGGITAATIKNAPVISGYGY